MPGQQFQTSFIPKKPLIAENPGTQTREPVSIFLILSILVFLASVASVGGVYLWEKTALEQQAVYKETLAQNRSSFGEEQLEIFKKLNTKITIAQEHINTLLTPRALFDILSAVTVQSIRYKNFTFTPPLKVGDPIKIAMTGEGAGFQAVAYQSDVLAGQSRIKNPVLADFAVNENGFVSFSFSGEIDPKDVLYRSQFGTTNSSVQVNSPVGGSAPASSAAQTAPTTQAPAADPSAVDLGNLDDLNF